MRALIIIDLQNGVCHGKTEIYNFKSLIQGVNKRIEQYRINQLPIIFIQHNDDDLVNGKTDWEIVSELDYLKSDLTIQKIHADSFYHTNLQSTLNDLNVAEVEICGAQTEYCVDTTIKVAHNLGYQISMYKSLTSTLNNPFMNAEKTIKFYENIWQARFLKLEKI